MAAAAFKCAGDVLDRGRRGIIGNEVARELGRDVLGRRRSRGEIGQHRQPLRLIRLSVAFAHDGLGARLMHFGAEHKRADGAVRQSALSAADGPTGQDLRKAGHIGLRVTRVHTKCVQLEDLAREILVQSERAPALCSTARQGRVRTDGLLIVQIQQHGRVRFDRQQQVAKSAHHVRTDRFALETAGNAQHRKLVDRDGEMIAPEMHQPLGKRPVAEQRGVQARAGVVDINRTQVLRQAHGHIGLRCRIGERRAGITRVGAWSHGAGLARFATLAHDRLGAAQDLLGALQAGCLHQRRTAWELRAQPTLRILGDGRQIARARAQAEAIGGDGSGDINGQRALLAKGSSPVPLQRASR